MNKTTKELYMALKNLIWQWDNHKTLMGLALADARAALANATHVHLTTFDSDDANLINPA